MAQLNEPSLRFGSKVPAEVKPYTVGLSFLQSAQSDSGSWKPRGLLIEPKWYRCACILSLLANGEDQTLDDTQPIRRGLVHLVSQQDAETGYFESSMYNHGFSMLALAGLWCC